METESSNTELVEQPQGTKSKSTFKIILSTVLVIIILVILVLAGFAFWAFHSYQTFEGSDKQQVISLVNNFINDINNNKINEAFDLTDKKGATFEEFSKTIQTLKTVTYGYTSQDTDFQNVHVTLFIGGDKQVIYQTKINFSDNTTGTLNVTALKTNGKWELTVFGFIASPEHIRAYKS